MTEKCMQNTQVACEGDKQWHAKWAIVRMAKSNKSGVGSTKVGLHDGNLHSLFTDCICTLTTRPYREEIVRLAEMNERVRQSREEGLSVSNQNGGG